MQAPRDRSGTPPGEEFRLTVRVYFEDTDAGGVVYYANYLKFCERARTEWLRTLGFAQGQLIEASGVAFVVRKVAADYLASARLDDELQVVSRIERLGGASIVFDQWVECGGTRLFEARITVACIDLGRHAATAIPSHIRRRLAQPD
ncbi:MAG: tol-pal system-associated acyl-CoA thioesterase [Rhodocyclaceae bacterium]|nr:tol-pal system-associated acyl-CoA thioesterase [Rhodocyclaceae bacterium]